MIIPNEWKKSSVSEICKLQNGNSFKPQDWDTKGLPIIRIQNLNGSDNFNYFSGIPQERWIIETGDLLFSWAGTKGVSFGPFVWRGIKGVLNQHIYKVQAQDSIDEEWLFYVLKYVTIKIENKAHGFKKTLVHVKKKDIDDQVISLPPLLEQQKIAKILTTWDKAISATERLIDNSTQQKKALMQQLLTGKKRLLDESGKRFEGEWEALTIGDVVELFNGYAFKSSDALEKGYKWLKIANVGIGEIKWDSSSYLPEGYEDEYNRFNLKVGDVVVAMTRPTLGNQLKIARLKNKADESLLNQRVAKLLFSEKVSSEYMYQLLSTIEVALKLNHALLGTDPPNLSTKVLHKISMELPPLIEQQKIATVLTNADKEIELLEQQLADFQQEKKALMQVLLTGKKRVVVDGDNS